MRVVLTGIANRFHQMFDKHQRLVFHTLNGYSKEFGVHNMRIFVMVFAVKLQIWGGGGGGHTD